MKFLRPYQNELINGVRLAYKEGYKAPCIVLGCGGGKSVITAEIAKLTTKNKKRVLFLVHRKELVEQIKKTFFYWGVNMDLCHVGMVQTICRRLDKLPIPSLIITDENHHSLANSYKKVYEHFKDVKRIGVTATPIRLNGDGLGDVNDKLIIGPTTKWLIENNYLSKYDYYSPSLVDLTGIKINKGEFDTASVEKLMLKKAIFGDVIKHYKHLADGKQSICYCTSIKHSIETATAFNMAGIEAEHIDGTTPPSQRDAIIKKFRDGAIDILCNVDLISEGFDVPDCECAILLRPTQSLTLYIQQSMRCMRFKPNKRAVIIDHVGNYARFGLPDEDRSWSLEALPKIKKKKNEDEDNLIKVKECPECFFTFSPFDEKGDPILICPQCGYEFPQKQEREIEVEEAKLEKIEGFTLNLKRHEDCKTYSELLDYAKQNGFKKGWAYYKGKELGLLNAGA